MKKLLILFFAVVLLSCNQDDENPVIDEGYVFQDGFEAGSFEELFPADGSRWSSLQQVNLEIGDNSIELSDSIANEGSKSLKIIAMPSDETLSKIDIEKSGFFAPIGSVVVIEADFFIKSGENLQDLFLIDLECCTCWDPSVPDNQCPGIRLKFGGGNSYLSIERGKILETTINQTAQAFPLDEWVRIKWEMSLSPNSDGENRLYIDGNPVIDLQAVNMPNPETFQAAFAMNGIDFALQWPLGYERIQIGATANPTAHAFEIYVDDFMISVR